MSTDAKFVETLLENNVKTLNDFLPIASVSDKRKYYYEDPTSRRFYTALAIKDRLAKDMQTTDPFEYLRYITRHGKVSTPVLDIFRTNGISIKDFAYKLKSVINKEHPKIRSLRIVGPPNTGKSMIVQAIGSFLDTSFLSNTGSTSEFYFNDCIGRTLIVLEEAWIIPQTVDDFKSVMSGYRIGVNVKNMKKRTELRNVPVLLTGQTDAFGKGFLSAVDESALKLRCHTYHFTRPFPTVEVISELDIVHTIISQVDVDPDKLFTVDYEKLNMNMQNSGRSVKRKTPDEQDLSQDE